MLLVLLFILFYFINMQIIGTQFNGFSFVFLPYVFITIVNNTLWKNDFYPITTSAIGVMCFAMLSYEIGLLFYYRVNSQRHHANVSNAHLYSLHGTEINYIFVERFIAVVTIYRLMIIIYVYINGGLTAVSRNDFAALDLGIISGRLVICLYPAGWMIAMRLFGDQELSKKNKIKYGFFCVLIVVVQFMSTVKVYAMLFVLGVFLISIVFNKKNVIRGSILLVGIVMFMFFGNYAIRWFSIDKSVPTLDYTLIHFWKYIAGGTINLDGVINSGTTTYNIIDFWTQVLSPIPNEFLIPLGQKITCTGTIPYITNFPSVSPNHYELSNVTNLFGRLYGCGGWNVIGFSISVMLFAVITEKSVFEYRTAKSISGFLVGLALLGYSSLSFFSLYYATSTFWQVILYSYLFSKIAIKNTNKISSANSNGN